MPVPSTKHVQKTYLKFYSVPKWEANDQLPSAPKAVGTFKLRGRKGIPAVIVQQVWRRDDYCCVNEIPDGGRCGSKIGLQASPEAFGQDNRLIASDIKHI